MSTAQIQRGKVVWLNCGPGSTFTSLSHDWLQKHLDFKMAQYQHEAQSQINFLLLWFLQVAFQTTEPARRSSEMRPRRCLPDRNSNLVFSWHVSSRDEVQGEFSWVGAMWPDPGTDSRTSLMVTDSGSRKCCQDGLCWKLGLNGPAILPHSAKVLSSVGLRANKDHLSHFTSREAQEQNEKVLVSVAEKKY